jgi:hypothetical protein
MSNPFDKEREAYNAYAVYVNPLDLAEYRIIKTFDDPKLENDNSNWLVVTRNMWSGDYDDVKKIKAREVKNYSFLLSCTDDWSKHYAS